MHPIIEAQGPNHEQLPAILDRGRDVVVTAGAGTGKTRTLVSRYLSLLAAAAPIRSIVAITFTRKAAREMRNRVRAALHDFIESGSLSPEERREWSTRYSQLDAARIGTIHNLCTEILRAHPAEAGLDPRFEVLDEGEAGILVAQAIDEGLAWAADDNDAVHLFTFLGEYKLRQIVEDLMGKRLEAREALSDLPEPLWPHWQSRMAPALQKFVDDTAVLANFRELQALKTSGALAKAQAAGDLLAPDLEQLLLLWEQIQEGRVAGDWAAVSTLLQPLRQSMKQKGRQANWSPADPKAVIKELQQSYDDALGDLKKVHFNTALDMQWANLLPQLARLFDEINRRYSALKGWGLRLDFDDLESGALALLRDHPEVQTRWREEISAILVDEYQDTNHRQRDLVNQLTGASGKLFIVGDAKQSIYRFRGAEVAVFRQERDRIHQGEGIAYELSTSYRAHQRLLEGLNELLRPVLGNEADPQRPWREPFSSLNYHRLEPQAGVTAPFIELHMTVGSKGDGALYRAADALVSHLLELTNAEGSTITFGDVAILCRASTSFNAYESALDQAGIPYLTVAGRGFYDRPEIRDLLNMLQVVADPTDDLALAGLLRSPVIGLSDLDLYLLISEWRGADQRDSLWRMVQDQPAGSDEKIERAVAIVSQLNAMAGRVSVASVLEDFVNQTDYRAALRQSGSARAARNVSKLLLDAHDSGIVGIVEFLSYIQGLRSGPAREGEAPVTAGNAVRIMTIHAAKGLEFPVVVIGDINYDRRTSASLLLEPGLGVFPSLRDDDNAGSYMFHLLKAKEADQEDAESDRLLYVAATRAQEMLILSGCFSTNEGGKPTRLAGWLKKLSDPLGFGDQEFILDEDGSRVRQSFLQVGQSNVGCLLYERQFEAPRGIMASGSREKPCDHWSEKMLADLTQAAKKIDRPDDEVESAWYVLGGRRPSWAPRATVGALVHEALEAWRFPDDDFAPWIQALARSHGLTSQDQIKDACERVTELLKRFKKHPLYDVIRSAPRVLREVPYDYLDRDGKVEHGRIDLLYLKDGLWTIIDFKTDELGSDVALKEYIEAEKYNLQLARYENAVARLIRHRPRALLCFLDYQGEILLHPKPVQL